jgi:hypothetical protein
MMDEWSTFTPIHGNPPGSQAGALGAWYSLLIPCS